MKMKATEFLCLHLIFLWHLAFGAHDVYIVAIEGEPVVNYNGGVEGFTATAVDPLEEMDITRY